MPDDQSPPGGPPQGRRPAIGLQIKLPCADLAAVKVRYGEDLKRNAFFIRTKAPREKDTLVRLEALLAGGEPCFRAAAVVTRAQAPGVPGAEAGMALALLGVDENGRDLIASVGGKPPAALKEPAKRPVAPAPAPPATPAAPPIVDPATRPATAPIPPPKPPPAPERKGPAIGIDLGTTNSAAAVMQHGKPFVIPSREGYNTIPSIVALTDKGKLIVGHPAKSQLLINPHNTVFGAKRLIGRQYSSPAVEELKGRFPYAIVEGPRGEAAVRLGEQDFSLQQISAMVLTEVKEIAQQWLRTEVSRAVVTVPAYYNDNQRNAVREAGQLAGLQVERILNEPTAAALAFAHGKNLDTRILVYDLGGGTFDASVLELHGTLYEVVSTGGDTFLGGVDFDKVVVDHLLAQFKAKNGIDFPGDRVALQRVTDAAERAKIALSEQLEHKVKVPFVALVGEKPYDLEATITRAELAKLSGHLVDRTLEVCKQVLGTRGLTVADVSDVLLVGGQSRMPLVRERIRNFFGKEPSKGVHPDEAVALGAAVLAHSVESSDIDGVVLVDVLPMSIGVGLPGGRFKKLIERNTSLPHKRSLALGTTRDDQESLEIAIFQGEDDKVQENEYLGTLTVPGLPPGPKGSVSFELVFSLNPEAILTVTAEDRKSGRRLTARFSTRDTPEQLRQKLQIEAAPAEQEVPAPAQAGLAGRLKRLFGAK